MPTTLRFLGGTGTVTGSKYLLESAQDKVLVDCGLFQGAKPLRLRNWEAPPFDPGELTGVLLTHAHLDHSGYLPRLVKRGYAGRVTASRGTRDLCAILLPDSGHLQEEEARYANKGSYSRHKPALPLYTEEEARQSLKRFAPVEFREDFELGAFRCDLRPAGHILGASIARVRSSGTTVVFSGDLGRSNDPIMHPPARVPEADYIVVESTYGNRLHGAADPEAELGGHLARVLGRGGVVVIPAFAVGRAQALTLYISRLKARHVIPDVPIFLNSPMAIDATRLYHEYRAEHRLTVEECTAACAVAQMVHTPEASRALNMRPGPMIIVSASGMATGGRVLHHLKAFAPDPRNMVLLPGFQAAGTRGAALAAGAAKIRMHGIDVAVRAEVVQLDAMSAHADYADILDWLRGFQRPPRHVFVTHGEPEAADALRRRIAGELRWDVSVPDYGETVGLRG